MCGDYLKVITHIADEYIPFVHDDLVNKTFLHNALTLSPTIRTHIVSRLF
jgi:hypothetical protein